MAGEQWQENNKGYGNNTMTGEQCKEMENNARIGKTIQ